MAIWDRRGELESTYWRRFSLKARELTEKVKYVHGYHFNFIEKMQKFNSNLQEQISTILVDIARLTTTQQSKNVFVRIKRFCVYGGTVKFLSNTNYWKWIILSMQNLTSNKYNKSATLVNLNKEAIRKLDL